MALNIKRLERLPHPTEQVNNDQVPVEEPGRGAEGSKNYEDNINDSKRFSLVRGYVEAIYRDQKNPKKKRKEKRKNFFKSISEKHQHAKEKAKEKKKKFADAIRRLNIL
ncbi:hypothetical protein BALOs_1437 [Halobacteriovorax sp. BALOs_7]|uniref:hypothetical protein n=1 Tax=Halobacteriovorax sp. BALOs_7 TaxID=2109558 RepID=UPI000EA039A7|nr:hypothetical protein [Halobacteriovorax sp. BALOs_7]AYF44438.1 hypothetical protein BALOs_1437 [Halobacteriovorax sp. BALOs_7]